MITMPCSLATSCISRTVGPSGIRSTASYQRVCCSAQKYGVVKISCIQTICTPCFAASSINFKCFSIFSRLISSIGRSVEAAFEHCINAHLTVRGIKRLSLRAACQDVVYAESEGKSNEPCVSVKAVEEGRIVDLAAGCACGAQEAGHHRRDGEAKRGDRPPVEPASVRIWAVRIEQTFEVQALFPEHPVVTDENTGDCSHQTRVTDQPRENVSAHRGHQLPGHHQDSDNSGDQATRDVRDQPRIQIRTVVGRR